MASATAAPHTAIPLGATPVAYRVESGEALLFRTDPEPDGRPSRWVLAAGPARSGKQQLLLGVALLTDEETTIGRLTLEPPRWSEIFRMREPQ